MSAGSSTIPSMGPAVRAAAGDAARQILELASQRWHRELRTLSLKGGNVVCSDGGAWPIADLLGLLESAQILGSGARGPNPTGMRVLTFGVQVAEVAVDVETGEVRVERIAAIHDVGRILNPLGARSQVEGGIVQAIGHTLSEQRLIDPASGAVLTQTLDAYKLPTIADVPEIVCELIDEPDIAPDEPRREGPRRAADHPDGGGDRERDPRRDGRRRALAADHPRGDAGRAGARAGEGEGWSCFGLSRSRRPSLRSETVRSRLARRHRPRAAAARPDRRPRTRSSSCGAPSRAGYIGVHLHVHRSYTAITIGSRHDARRARGRPRDPGGASRGLPPLGLAAAPRDGHDRRQPASGDPLLVLAAQVPVLPPRRRPLPREGGAAPRARVLRQRPLRVGAPVRSGRGAPRARRPHPHRPARARPRGASTACRPTTTAT